MDQLRSFLGQSIKLEISGSGLCEGTLYDAGLDIIVMYQEPHFCYIPFVHVQQIQRSSIAAVSLDTIEPAFDFVNDPISYRKVLDHAKGRFVEIYVTGNKTIHGYLTSIMNDYFIFHSPVYKTLFVSLDHVKWIIPYPPNQTPYSLEHHHFPVNPTTVSLSRSFEQQCKRLEGKFVVFDLGDHPNKIGQLDQVVNNRVELITANGERVLWNLRHLKVFHLPGVI